MYTHIDNSSMSIHVLLRGDACTCKKINSIETRSNLFMYLRRIEAEITGKDKPVQRQVHPYKYHPYGNPGARINKRGTKNWIFPLDEAGSNEVGMNRGNSRSKKPTVPKNPDIFSFFLPAPVVSWFDDTVSGNRRVERKNGRSRKYGWILRSMMILFYFRCVVYINRGAGSRKRFRRIVWYDCFAEWGMIVRINIKVERNEIVGSVVISEDRVH